MNCFVPALYTQALSFVGHTWPQLPLEQRHKHSCHAAINNIIHHSLAAAKIPSHLLRSDGRRPDGLGMASLCVAKAVKRAGEGAAQSFNCIEVQNKFNVMT